jgi:hypothetical protein
MNTAFSFLKTLQNEVQWVAQPPEIQYVSDQ